MSRSQPDKINSLLESLEKRKVQAKMFADDLAIAAEDANELQLSLSALAIWCEENEMVVNTEKTKAVKFRKAGATGRTKLYINRVPIEFVSSFKYLGITVQPALGFNDHVDQLLTRTASAIACLGSLKKLPIPLATRIFSIKITPMIRYGMSVIAPRLARTTMTKLVRCKSMFFKAVTGMSKNASNTFVLALVDEETLCQDLKAEGFQFTAWPEYEEQIVSKRRIFDSQDYSRGPAFLGKEWKLQNRTDRSQICRATFHGYHHKLCERGDFFEEVNELCICKYCRERAPGRHHIVHCKHFTGLAIGKISKQLEKKKSVETYE